MEIKDISVNAWKQMLKCSNPPKQKKSVISSGHSYIAIKGNDIALFNNVKEAESNAYRKLSLTEIVDVSKKIIGNGTTPKDSSAITKQVKKLTDVKDSKLNSVVKRIGRFALKCLKIISYVSLIGIPLGQKIGAWEGNIKSHQEEIIKARQFAQLSSNPSRTTAYLENISNILQAESNKTSLITNVLEGTLDDSMKATLADSNTLVQFQKDHTRPGTALILNDGENHYRGKTLKSGENAEQHYLNELKQVNKLVDKLDSDKKWSKLIQAVCTQTTGNSALYGLKVNALDLGLSSSSIWSDRLGDYRYQVQEKNIPIELSVIRNSTGEIEKLAVKSVIPTNVYQVRSELQPTVCEVANAIVSLQATLNFELKLDGAEQPQVSNLRLNFELKE